MVYFAIQISRSFISCELNSFLCQVVFRFISAVSSNNQLPRYALCLKKCTWIKMIRIWQVRKSIVMVMPVWDNHTNNERKKKVPRTSHRLYAGKTETKSLRTSCLSYQTKNWYKKWTILTVIACHIRTCGSCATWLLSSSQFVVK